MNPSLIPSNHPFLKDFFPLIKPPINKDKIKKISLKTLVDLEENRPL